MKKIIAGLGLLALTSASLSAQENPLVVKAGLAYNIVQTNELSKNCLGVETLLEKKLGEKIFAEWEIGLYADTRTTSEIVYSKMQTNMGFEYKPIIKNGWAMGGKLALGVSNEFYKQIQEAAPYKRTTLNKLIGLDIEKKFKGGNGINISVSKEIDNDIWRVGAKVILKSEDKRDENHSKKNHYPWPNF